MIIHKKKQHLNKVYKKRMLPSSCETFSVVTFFFGDLITFGDFATNNTNDQYFIFKYSATKIFK